MGADLYIKKMDRNRQYTGFEVSERAVNLGYFRDCYNDVGLFSVISANLGVSLSWWQTQDRKELFCKDGNMSIAGCEKWLKELEPIIKQFKELSVLYDSNYSMKKRCCEKGIKIKNIKEYHDWADNLINFLKLAIKKKSTVIWSV